MALTLDIAKALSVSGKRKLVFAPKYLDQDFLNGCALSSAKLPFEIYQAAERK